MELQYQGKQSLDAIQAKIFASQQEAAPIHTENQQGLLLQGDNFSIMSRLLADYANRVDLVYIDPPFNTKGSFRFGAQRTATISHSKTDMLAYEDALPLAEYLEFIRERLVLIHRLLSPQGTLYFHIDIKTGHYIKLLLDEIFGMENFLNDITRIKSNPKNFARKAYGNQKDVIYVYAKQNPRQIFNHIRMPLGQEEIKKHFPKTDQQGRAYTTVPCHAPGETQNGPTGQPWRGLQPPPGRHWRCNPAELEKLDQAGLIEWSKNGNPRIIKFAADHQGKKIQDVWSNFKDPQYPSYPTEKNQEMLDLIVKQSSLPGSIVMDCFCGSGTFLKAGRQNQRFVIGIDQSPVAIAVASKRPELSGLAKIQIDAGQEEIPSK